MTKTNNKDFPQLLLLVILFSISIVNSTSFANSNSRIFFKSDGQLKINLDIVQFEGIDNKTKVEFYYSFDPNQSISNTNKQSSNTYVFSLQVFNNNDELIFNEEEKKTFNNLEDSVKPSIYYNLKNTNIEPGQIKVILSIKENNSNIEGRIREVIEIQSFNKQLSLSDIMLISYIKKKENFSVFERNNLTIIPNPSKVLQTSNNSYLKFYYEINNMSFNGDIVETYTIINKIEDQLGNEITKKIEDDIQKDASSFARVGKMNVSNLERGIFRLAVTIIDNSTKSKYSKIKYFEIKHKNREVKLVLPMEDKDIKKYYEQLKYIARQDEIDIFEKLNAIGKQEFLIEFWKKRDTNPKTETNEFMIEHFRRIKVSEEKFKGGINSDRGRVYIVYGPPVDIERIESTMGDSKSLIKWIYGIEGRVEFIFVDRTNDGRYVLVHSTHSNEIYNSNWKNY